jgi:hypothetical protein
MERNQPCDKWVCHHTMTCPQVADGGTASYLEDSCEYIKLAVVDSRQGWSSSLGGGQGAKNSSP